MFLKSKLRMLEAGVNMRKWPSNSKELIEKIKASDYNQEVKCSDELTNCKKMKEPILA